MSVDTVVYFASVTVGVLSVFGVMATVTYLIKGRDL